MRRFAAGFVLLLAAALAHAQGGPPMITDDPGTPGDGHWEINTAWTDQHTPGASLYGLPLLDANYGVGDRLQLNYQGSWNVLHASGEPTESGISDSQLAVKWRFVDMGDNGLQVSTYPRVFFLTPGSDSDRKGLADPSTTWLLPFEIQKTFSVISFDAEVGHMFSRSSSDSGWLGGICLGHQLSKHWELDAEVHFTTDNAVSRAEDIVNVGVRWDLGLHETVLLAIGRDVRDTLLPEANLLTYAGIQSRF